MQLWFDRTGFPYLYVNSLQMVVSLWPVMKVQYEYFLASPHGGNEELYSEWLSINPRTSWRHFHAHQEEQLFLTGLTAEETAPFLRWLGSDFRLLMYHEWRKIDETYEQMGDITPANYNVLINMARMSVPARTILHRFRGQRRHVWSHCTFFQDGIMEWVYGLNRRLGLYGRPSPDLMEVMLNPRIHEPIHLIDNSRNRAFGFRAVCPWVQNKGVKQ